MWEVPFLMDWVVYLHDSPDHGKKQPVFLYFYGEKDKGRPGGLVTRASPVFHTYGLESVAYTDHHPIDHRRTEHKKSAPT